MSTRKGTFYAPWPVLDGKRLQHQWGEIRSNTAELKALARHSYQDIEDNVDELNALRAIVGQAYGDLDDPNAFRFIYDSTTEELCLQKNDGTEASPSWIDVWCVRPSDGQVQIVAEGGIQSNAGFYGPGLQSIEEIGEDGTGSDYTVRNPTKLFFNVVDGFSVSEISSGANQGAPLVGFSYPHGLARTYDKTGAEWVVEHNFGVSPVLVQVMDAGNSIIIPNKADVSDPNTAYFYFTQVVQGRVLIATGGIGSPSILPRDPFYLVVRTTDKSSDGNLMRPNAELVFDANHFYTNVDLDTDDGGRRKRAIVSLTTPYRSQYSANFVLNDSLTSGDVNDYWPPAGAGGLKLSGSNVETVTASEQGGIYVHPVPHTSTIRIRRVVISYNADALGSGNSVVTAVKSTDTSDAETTLYAALNLTLSYSAGIDFAAADSGPVSIDCPANTGALSMAFSSITGTPSLNASANIIYEVID